MGKYIMPTDLEKMIESITVDLNNEILTRGENDNLKMSIFEEAATRAEKDAEIRIKLANTSAENAEADSKLSQRISTESSSRAKDTSDLNIKIYNLECKISKLQNCMNEEECSCETKTEPETKPECSCCKEEDKEEDKEE